MTLPERPRPAPPRPLACRAGVHGCAPAQRCSGGVIPEGGQGGRVRPASGRGAENCGRNCSGRNAFLVYDRRAAPPSRCNCSSCNCLRQVPAPASWRGCAACWAREGLNGVRAPWGGGFDSFSPPSPRRRGVSRPQRSTCVDLLQGAFTHSSWRGLGSTRVGGGQGGAGGAAMSTNGLKRRAVSSPRAGGPFGAAPPAPRPRAAWGARHRPGRSQSLGGGGGLGVVWCGVVWSFSSSWGTSRPPSPRSRQGGALPRRRRPTLAPPPPRPRSSGPRGLGASGPAGGGGAFAARPPPAAPGPAYPGPSAPPLCSAGGRGRPRGSGPRARRTSSCSSRC